MRRQYPENLDDEYEYGESIGPDANAAADPYPYPEYRTDYDEYLRQYDQNAEQAYDGGAYGAYLDTPYGQNAYDAYGQPLSYDYRDDPYGYGAYAWLLVGNNEGMFDEQTMVDYPVSVENHDPKKIVSGDLYTHNRNTYFIIYGTAIRKESRYTIENNQWNILGDIDSRNSFRLNFSRKYLTIYDYKWFDNVREWIGLYSDNP